MEKLDYSSIVRPSPWSRFSQAVKIAAAVLLVPVVLCCGGITVPSLIFRARMHGANVIGKTQAQITAQLGPPDPWDTTTQPDGTVIMFYPGPLGDGYRIDIRNGIAVYTLDLSK